MILSINAKQNYIYMMLIVLTSIGSIFLYRATQQQWILFRKAEIKFHHKEYEEAISLYKKSLEAGFPLSKLALKLAQSYVTVGKFKEAIELYKVYLSEHPQDKRVHLDLARALSYIGNFKASEDEYKMILEQ